MQLSLELSFFKQLLKVLSLEQMQEVAQFLAIEMKRKIEAGAPENDFPKPTFTPDMVVAWEEEVFKEEEQEMSEEEFVKAVQEMS